jgi:hypothetical protein
MDDTEFKDQYKPIPVPARFTDANRLQDQVIFALAENGQGTADEITKTLESLIPDAPNKEVIANVHHVLSGLYEKGLIAGRESNGNLIYSLQKITQANSGKVTGGNPGS